MFQKVNMASESIDSFMRSVLVVNTDGETPIAAKGGDFVTPVGIATSSVYDTPDENVLLVKAPTANTETNILVLDPVKVAEATNNDLVYRMGVRTLGLDVKAGEIVAARQLALNDQFLLDEAHFAAKPAKGEKFALTANQSILTKVDGGAPATGFLFTVEDVRTITEGIGLGRQTAAYLVRVTRI